MKRTKIKELQKNAVEYISYGWQITPLEPFTDTPVANNGKHVVIADYRRCLHWWTMEGAGSNIGLLLRANKMVALRFKKNKTIDGLKYAQKIYTYGVNSPSIIAPNGDIYVLYNRNNINKFNSGGQNQFLSHGIELMTDGCVVLPPSCDKAGQEYKWATNPNNPLAKLPKWIDDLLPNPKYEIFIDWIKECCNDKSDSHVTTSDAYCCYKEWAEEQILQEYHRLNQQEFSAEMARRYRKERIYAKNGSRPNCYLGVEIL